MKFYTFQIGDGDGTTINALSHSESLIAKELTDAIDKAKSITRARPLSADENTVRLLEETDGDSIVMWVRPAEVVR